jgi:predicted nucleic acid-binding protein
MPDGRPFFDANVLLYLLSADEAKANRAEELLAGGGTISVQVLNEFAAVASRKLEMTWGEIRDALDPIRTVCEIAPLTLATHDRALDLAERYGLSFYDATIVASALDAGCDTLYTEDLQDGQVIEKQLTVRNPFLPTRRQRP